MCGRFISKIGFVSKFSAAILFLTLTGSFAQSTAGSIRGQVISVTGDPVRKADVTLRFVGKRPGPGNVMLSPSDAAGEFVFNNLDPGNYIVSGQKNGFVSQDRHRPAFQAVSVESTLAVTGTIADVQVLLAKGAVTIQGTVADSDGKPVSECSIAVLPPSEKRADRGLFRSTESDQSGRFTLRNLRPGEYTLVALGVDEDASNVQNPEYLKRVEKKGTTLKLTENLSRHVQPKVIDE